MKKNKKTNEPEFSGFGLQFGGRRIDLITGRVFGERRKRTIPESELIEMRQTVKLVLSLQGRLDHVSELEKKIAEKEQSDKDAQISSRIEKFINSLKTPDENKIDEILADEDSERAYL